MTYKQTMLETKFLLNGFCPAIINIGVVGLKPIVAMLMLALLAFASSHPLLEGLELIHQEAAHADGPVGSDSHHDLADGKCRGNSSRDEIQRSSSSGAFSFTQIFALACVLVDDTDCSNHPCVEAATSPPPELGTTWQFSSRAALPARAPSLTS